MRKVDGYGHFRVSSERFLPPRMEPIIDWVVKVEVCFELYCPLKMAGFINVTRRYSSLRYSESVRDLHPNFKL